MKETVKYKAIVDDAISSTAYQISSIALDLKKNTNLQRTNKVENLCIYSISPIFCLLVALEVPTI